MLNTDCRTTPQLIVAVARNRYHRSHFQPSLFPKKIESGSNAPLSPKKLVEIGATNAIRSGQSIEDEAHNRILQYPFLFPITTREKASLNRIRKTPTVDEGLKWLHSVTHQPTVAMANQPSIERAACPGVNVTNVANKPGEITRALKVDAIVNLVQRCERELRTAISTSSLSVIQSELIAQKKVTGIALKTPINSLDRIDAADGVDKLNLAETRARAALCGVSFTKGTTLLQMKDILKTTGTFNLPIEF
jgi:hypothetical protein